MRCSAASARAQSFSSAMTSSVACSAADANGPPPKVLPRSPPPTLEATLSGSNTAPRGNPEAIPFAQATTSGSMPKCWNANGVPKRPKPVCTSSMIRKVPLARHFACNACSQSGFAVFTPAMDCMGSTITAATCAKSACASAGVSLNGNSSQGAHNAAMGALSLGRSEHDMARRVRPWNPPWKPTNRVRPVSCAASFKAFSLASAPELQKNTEEMCGPANSTSDSAANVRIGKLAAVE